MDVMNIPAGAVFLPVDLEQRFLKLGVLEQSGVLERGPEGPQIKV